MITRTQIEARARTMLVQLVGQGYTCKNLPIVTETTTLKEIFADNLCRWLTPTAALFALQHWIYRFFHVPLKVDVETFTQMTFGDLIDYITNRVITKDALEV